MWDTSVVPTNNRALIPCFRAFAHLPSSSSSTARREMLQSLGGITPRFVNRSWLRNLTVCAMTFSSSYDYGDQSRGGLSRFYSKIVPPSKAFILFPFLSAL